MKELEKNYNPADIEARLYQKWLGIVSKKRGKEPVPHCNAAAEHYRTAPHGPRSGQYHAGYFNPLQENAGL